MARLTVGQVARVKKNTPDPDFPEYFLDYWQGEIIEIFEDENYKTWVTIELDAPTLRNIDENHILKSILSDLDYFNITVPVDALEPENLRDTPEEREELQNQLSLKYWWRHFGLEGEEIDAIIGAPKAIYDTRADMAVWWNYLKTNLKFPLQFATEVPLDKNSTYPGDKVNVMSLASIDLEQGIMVKVKARGKEWFIPLARLQVEDINRPAELYKFWYFNRPEFDENLL